MSVGVGRRLRSGGVPSFPGTFALLALVAPIPPLVRRQFNLNKKLPVENILIYTLDWHQTWSHAEHCVKLYEKEQNVIKIFIPNIKIAVSVKKNNKFCLFIFHLSAL